MSTDCESRMMHVIQCLQDAQAATYAGMRALRDAKVSEAVSNAEAALYQLRTVELIGNQEANEIKSIRANKRPATVKEAEVPGAPMPEPVGKTND